jgi:predicted nucleic acid-binding protein
MVYVLDASFIGALIIPDEKNPFVEGLYSKIENEDEKYAPHLLWYEMANIFMNLIRRKRYTIDETLQFFPLLSAIRLTDDFETGAVYAKSLLRLSAAYNISSYDAAYLELAKRKKAALCTMDENLRIAAGRHGVTCL